MSQQAGRAIDSETADPRWKGLYIAGGVAALIAVLFFRRNFGTEMVAFGGFGVWNVPSVHPSTAAGWFALLQDNAFIGLLLFDLIDLVNYALVGLIFLALYAALHRASRSAMAIATASGLVGVAVYFASNQAFAMLSLSDRYAAETADAQRAMFLAAGEALLAIYNPGAIYQGTGYYVGYSLVLLAGLIISVVMLRSRALGKATAYVGILANALALAHFVVLAFMPSIVALPTAVSAPFRVLWMVLIALGLFRLGRRKTDARGKRDDS
jgi:hypothetical protein